MKKKLILICLISAIFNFSCKNDDDSQPIEESINFTTAVLFGDMNANLIDDGASAIKNNNAISYSFDLEFSASAVGDNVNISKVDIFANITNNNGVDINVPIYLDFETFNFNINKIERTINSSLVEGGIAELNYIEYSILTTDELITTYRSEPIL